MIAQMGGIPGPHRNLTGNSSAGGAGGRRPPAGARGVLASFSCSSPAAAGGTGMVPEELL